MSKNDEKDEFERPPTPEAPHGNVMDKAGLKPEKVRRNATSTTFFFLKDNTHTLKTGIQEYGIYEQSGSTSYSYIV